MLRKGEIAFLREEHDNWLSNIKWSALKAYTHLTLYKQSQRIKNIHAYTYVYVTIVSRGKEP